MRRRFTQREDKLILKLAKANPNNLSYAFSLAADQTNRTQGSISNHYYNKIRKEHNVFSVTVGDKVVSKNRKNKAILNTKNFKKYFLNLSRVERMKLLISLIR